jgi:uncharacterized protein YciI
MFPERRRPGIAGPVHRGRLGAHTSSLFASFKMNEFAVRMLADLPKTISFSAIMGAETPMGYYALFYREVVPDFITERGAYREEHLGLAREAHSRGELLLAGALADPPDGALLIFRGGDETPAREFVRKDPYVRNGLVKRWEIRPWSVVVGNQ